jgi:GNAT superfamily N-acetyltransferase
VAERGGQPVGYALYFFTYSSFLAQPTLYLEDIFVLPEHRGVGAGKAMMRRLFQEAVAKDCGRMEWQVLDWNEPSIRFYQRLGAQHQKEWLPYRLLRDRLDTLAR